MAARDARVDAYIAQAAPFARPILAHLRDIVHRACPDVEETIKWSSPHFTWNGMLCHMAAFKQHCAFGFWKGELVVDDAGQRVDAAMGQFGRITALSDLPSATQLAQYIRRAMQLNVDGVKTPTRSKPKRAPDDLAIPDVLAAALKKNTAARTTFEAFSPSHKREYAEWIAEAKTDATRDKRLATTLEWLAEGKSRHWKYAKC